MISAQTHSAFVARETASLIYRKRWTGLSCFQLHLDRADVADGRVAPGSIVEAFDVKPSRTICRLLVTRSIALHYGNRCMLRRGSAKSGKADAACSGGDPELALFVRLARSVLSR